MLIDVNGLPHFLTIRAVPGQSRLTATIVDEAFQFGKMTAQVRKPGHVLALIERYSGVRPDATVTAAVADTLEEVLFQQAQDGTVVESASAA